MQYYFEVVIGGLYAQRVLVEAYNPIEAGRKVVDEILKKRGVMLEPFIISITRTDIDWIVDA